MTVSEIHCPVCKEPIPYANSRNKVTCLFCGSQFEVSLVGDCYSYNVTLNGRKIIWAPPLAWPKLKQDIYFSRNKLHILEDDRLEKTAEINEKIMMVEAQSELDSAIIANEIANLHEELRLFIESKDKEIADLSDKLEQQLCAAKETGHPEYL